MLEFISEFWWVWVFTFLVCAYFVGYSKWKARQQKDFVVTGSALIGCLLAFFSAIGAISAILSIIACVMKLLVWIVID